MDKKLTATKIYLTLYDIGTDVVVEKHNPNLFDVQFTTLNIGEGLYAIDKLFTGFKKVLQIESVGTNGFLIAAKELK